MAKIEYYRGQKINKVTYIEDVYCGKDRKAKFVCYCGNEFVAWIHSVKSNVTKSCGCFRKEYMKNKQKKHGHSRHPLYNAYTNMIERCYTPQNVSYQDYGGRGVVVCEEWLKDFNKFYNWSISNGWKPGLQIDKDINGDGKMYSPDTCIFVTPRQNSNRRRTSRFIEHNGLRKTLAEWAASVNMLSGTLFARLKSGWSMDKAITTSTKEYHGRK